MLDKRMTHIRTTVTRFWNSKDGATALLFGLSLFVLFGAAGFGLDFSRVSQERNQLQMAGDAAAIAAAKQRFFDKSESKMQQVANEVFAANYRGSLTGATPVLTPENGQVSVNLVGTVPMTLLTAVGINTMNVSTVSTARIPTAIDAEIVFVLDYSSSMNSAGKYDTMRDAAIQLVEDLTANKKSIDQNLTFALVPFAEYVYGKFPKRFIVGQDPTDGGDMDTCVNGREHPHNVTDTTPVPTDDATRWISMTPPSGSDPCEPFKDNKLEVLPLTDDYSKVKNQLQDMSPHYLTNISLGLEMGWHAISPNEPFTQGVAYSNTITKKFIILLSDGRQTMPGKGPGGIDTIAAAEANLEQMCTAIKAKGVHLVTVAFDLQDTATETRLKNCADSPAFYFDADTNSDLTQSFKDITEMLADNLRITK